MQIKTQKPTLDLTQLFGAHGSDTVSSWRWMQKKENQSWLDEQFEKFAKADAARAANEKISADLKEEAERQLDSAKNIVKDAEARAVKIEEDAKDGLAAKQRTLDEKSTRLATSEDELKKRAGKVELASQAAKDAQDAAGRTMGEAKRTQYAADKLKAEYDELTSKLVAAMPAELTNAG